MTATSRHSAILAKQPICSKQRHRFSGRTFRHYAKDIASRNVRLRDFMRYVPIRAFIAAFQFMIRLNWRGRRYPQYPMIRGLAAEKTPAEVLNLKPGELVQVRSKNEIMRTTNAGQKNRGLWYDEEMLPYCNKVHRVFKRVERIIDLPPISRTPG